MVSDASQTKLIIIVLLKLMRHKAYYAILNLGQEGYVRESVAIKTG